MNLFHACWLVCILAASYNLWFGRSRIVLRPVCLLDYTGGVCRAAKTKRVGTLDQIAQQRSPLSGFIF